MILSSTSFKPLFNHEHTLSHTYEIILKMIVMGMNNAQYGSWNWELLFANHLVLNQVNSVWVYDNFRGFKVVNFDAICLKNPLNKNINLLCGNLHSSKLLSDSSN